MNKSFCVLPWNNVSVDPDGSVKPCCVYKGFIKKPDGTAYNLGYDKIEDFYNSPDYVTIREKMLKGEEISGCIQCKNYESYGKESRRINSNNAFPNQLNKTSSIADTKIEYFDLRFGNLCNLQCRSCTPRNSSQLNKQVIKYPELKKYYKIIDDDVNQWYETDIFEDNVYSNLKHLRILYITGGEPTLIQKNFELLEKLINEGYSKNIILIIHSNMTNNKYTFFDLLSHFKKVRFLASIDGYKDMQEYLRYPSDWDQIDNNLTKLVFGNYSNIDIRVSAVMQITNIGKMTELFEYCEEFNRQAGKSVLGIDLNSLEFPPHLNIIHLPIEYKLKCWERIENWVKNHCKYQPNFFYTQLDALKSKCSTEVDPKNNLNKYIEFNDLIDKQQKLTLAEVNPELYEILHK
jgi:organic radical activating enzyme